MHRGRLGHALLTEAGIELLVSMLNTMSIEIINRSIGNRRTLEGFESDGMGLQVFSLNPRETLVVNWNHTIANDAATGDTLGLASQAMYDENGDRIIVDDETRIADLLVTVASPASGFSLRQTAVSATGDSVFLPGSLLDFFAFVKNHTSERVTNVVLSLDLPVGIVYIPNSAAYTFGESMGPNARSLGDRWLDNDFSVGNLEPGQELIVTYQGMVNPRVARVGDELRLDAAAYGSGSLAVANELVLPVSGRGDLRASFHGASEAEPGDDMHISLTLTNAGDVPIDEVTFAADLGCGLSVIDGSGWVHTTFSTPIRGGVGFGVPSSALTEYLVNPDRSEPFRLEGEIEPGEVVDISFKVKVGDNLPLGTVLRPTLYGLGRSTDGYQLHSEQVRIEVVGREELATKDDIENAREAINQQLRETADELDKRVDDLDAQVENLSGAIGNAESPGSLVHTTNDLKQTIGVPSVDVQEGDATLWAAIEETQRDVDRNRSLLEQLMDVEWFGLEVFAAFIGLVVGAGGAAIGYAWRVGLISRGLARLRGRLSGTR